MDTTKVTAKLTITMSLPTHLAKHLRDVYFGGNWTTVSYKDALDGVTWQQATAKVHSFNTIATLIFHTYYYVAGVTKVLQGEPLTSKDEYSWNHPPIASAEDWETMLQTMWRDAETFAALIEQLPESKLWEDFSDPKYGNYYRNLQGIVEHLHYHLGQIVLIKKLLQRDITT